MVIESLSIEEIKLIYPDVYPDVRGYFFETFQQKRYVEALGVETWVQSNQSRSRKGVVRGLHYQLPPMAQAKLVRVVLGRILDVAVDIREGSKTFGHYEAVELDDQSHAQLFVPKGFAHGFFVLSDEAIVSYLCDAYWSREHERGIRWNDPSLAIPCPLKDSELLLSDRDAALPLLKDAQLFSCS